MVIVKLMGGLGNQMFQYAVGRCIAARRRVPLKFDMSWFAIQSKRAYQLAVFNISAQTASAEEIEAVKPRDRQPAQSFVERLINRFRPISRDSYFYENMLAPFRPEMPNARPPAYLEGYWQSEKYFLPVERLIRREFTLRQPPSRETLALAEQVSRPDAVSVHVRRGDYVQEAHTQAVHGTCGLEYYRAAAETVRNHVPGARFFVFSDDPAWAKENLTFLFPLTVVAHNPPERGHEDLWLMNQCRGHILANSSFSWWGAWLCQRMDKVVCAPEPWFNIEVDTCDLLPEGWMRVMR